MGRTADLDTHLRQQRKEDLAFLADQGETLESAAKRLGLSADALEKWLGNNDRALKARLMANNSMRLGHVRRGRVSR